MRRHVLATSLLVAVIAVVSIVATHHRSSTSSIGKLAQPSRSHVAIPHPQAVEPVVGAQPAHTSIQPAAPRTTASLAKMVGQQLMVRMTGLSPDQSLLSRIKDGQVGGVILYSDNVASAEQVRALVSQLQAAARAGGNPPLLIAVDQEGGEVKRLPWAPPDLSPPEIAAQGRAVAQSQGERAGQALKPLGINVDLAPVADVAHSAAAFIWQQRRSFGMSSTAVAADASAFAEGLSSAGVAPTAKHFPGLGAATTDTDYARQTLISESSDRAPYVSLIAQDIPLIMVSTGVYTNLDPSAPSALSHAVITGLLRGAMGYRGVVITDDLERPTGYTTADAAVRAARAGADIILASTTESGGATAYDALLNAAEQRAIPTSSIESAYQRIQRLKDAYAR